jgi:tetratricopeptide (TPR) repeat protein
MSGVDLHPEGLMEADARGELLVGDRERLEWHLEQCEVCRFERLARKDFRRELEDQDEELDVPRLLTHALLGGREIAAVASSPGWRKRRMRLGLLAAAAVMIAGTAAAAVGFSEMRVVIPGRLEAVAQRAVAPARTSVVPVPALAGVEPPLAPTPSSAGQRSDAPIDLQTAFTQAAGLTAPPTRPSPPSWAPSWGPSWTIGSGASSPERDAVALFARANRARRSGDHEQATRLYRELIERYRSSSEAHQAEAVLGQTLLDSNDPGGALRYFDDYLRADGALREDVTRDRAIALGLLGRADDEASAWAALLQAYPSSVHGERARKRLSELGKR